MNGGNTLVIDYVSPIKANLLSLKQADSADFFPVKDILTKG